MNVALIGRNLSHSISPEIHHAITPYTYGIKELEKESEVTTFVEIMKAGGDILISMLRFLIKKRLFRILTTFPRLPAAAAPSIL